MTTFARIIQARKWGVNPLFRQASQKASQRGVEPGGVLDVADVSGAGDRDVLRPWNGVGETLHDGWGKCCKIRFDRVEHGNGGIHEEHADVL
ncbi:MAG: hypothetical protein IH861_09985 [Chloroflexi bacterium]|nr:hypothetical protein [Chloroflexota bacterium]